MWPGAKRFKSLRNKYMCLLIYWMNFNNLFKIKINFLHNDWAVANTFLKKVNLILIQYLPTLFISMKSKGLLLCFTKECNYSYLCLKFIIAHLVMVSSYSWLVTNLVRSAGHEPLLLFRDWRQLLEHVCNTGRWIQ